MVILRHRVLTRSAIIRTGYQTLPEVVVVLVFLENFLDNGIRDGDVGQAPHPEAAKENMGSWCDGIKREWRGRIAGLYIGLMRGLSP